MKTTETSPTTKDDEELRRAFRPVVCDCAYHYHTHTRPAACPLCVNTNAQDPWTRLLSSSGGGSPLAEETRMQETLVTPSDIPFCWALLSMLKYANSLRCPMGRGRAPNPVPCRRRNGEYHTLASLTHCSLAHVTARWARQTGTVSSSGCGRLCLSSITNKPVYTMTPTWTSR